MKIIKKYQSQIAGYVCIWLMFAVLTASFFGLMWAFGFNPNHAPRFGKIFVSKVNMGWDILFSPTYILLGLIGFSRGSDKSTLDNLGACFWFFFFLFEELALLYAGFWFSLRCIPVLSPFVLLALICLAGNFWRNRSSLASD